jgi:hypothetical protein
MPKIFYLFEAKNWPRTLWFPSSQFRDKNKTLKIFIPNLGTDNWSSSVLSKKNPNIQVGVYHFLSFFLSIFYFDFVISVCLLSFTLWVRSSVFHNFSFVLPVVLCTACNLSKLQNREFSKVVNRIFKAVKCEAPFEYR